MVVPGEPADDDVACPQPDLDGHYLPARVEDGEQAGQVVAARGEQRVQQVGYPGVVEAVDGAGPPVLVRFPADERAEQVGVPRVVFQPESPHLTLELSALPLGLTAEAVCPLPQLAVVGVEAAAQVDDRGRGDV